MNEAVKKLKTIVGPMPLKMVGDQNTNLQDVLVDKGAEGVYDILCDEKQWEEIDEVSSHPVPTSHTETDEALQKTIAEETTRDVAEEQLRSLQNAPAIEVIHSGKLAVGFPLNTYYILGAIGQDLASLRITLMVEEKASARKERFKVDLYEREVVKAYATQLAETLCQSEEQIVEEMQLLTDLLEKYREKQMQISRPDYQQKRNRRRVSPEDEKACVGFLKKPDLIDKIDKLIQKAGVVGEESTRRLLFIIASTYKMTHPLHALVQGSSGSGKSHLINTIGNCLPSEDVMSMTRVTSKSFYHYSNDELVNKLMLIQDYDGLDEEAQYAFRELQSAGTVSSSTTYKDRFGNITSKVKTVKSHFASLLATTKAEVYYDNMSRSVILGVDETEEQTIRIIEHQNRKLAGLVDVKEEEQARLFLQNCIRCIDKYEVVNPYADKVRLPIEAKMLRRLNNHYQAFVKQITLLHQHQREKDEHGRLIAEPRDLKMACDILFDAIMLKVDDLDSSLRQFFDKMKAFIREQSNGEEKKYQFTQRDVRLALNISKTQCFRYMEDLELLEYVQRTGGYANRGYKYRIVFWDDMEKIRAKIKEELNNQLKELA